MSDLNEHDLKSVIPRTEGEMGKFLAYLFAAIAEMDRLNQILTPEQREASQQVNDNLSGLKERAKYLTALLMEMGETVKVLLNQRQNSKKSFILGWESFYADLMMHLSAEDREKLGSLLDDMVSDIPF